MTFRWPRLLGGWLAWAGAAGLLAMAWHLKHPLFYWLRPWQTPLLLLAGLAGSMAVLSRRQLFPRRACRILLGVALLAVPVITVYREAQHTFDREAVLAADDDMRTLGAHFVVGFERFADVEPLAVKGLIGGIYLTRRNLAHSTLTDVSAQIARLQALRHAAGLPPLIVAADQEGGPVAHLSPPLEVMPPLSALLADAPTADLAERARRYGRQQGRGLASLGVTLNLGPVVDLRPATVTMDDGLTRIAQRAIASDPALVATVAEGYVAGLAEAGVGATLKHFPGLGGVGVDTHTRQARLDRRTEDMADDWLPFQRVGGSSHAAMMVGHVLLPALDAQHAASHSRIVIQEVLRQAWGYQGVLITDDLNMGAVFDLGIGRVAGEALAAGVDLVLVSYDPAQYFPVLSGAASALRRGEISRDELAASAERLAHLR